MKATGDDELTSEERAKQECFQSHRRLVHLSQRFVRRCIGHYKLVRATRTRLQILGWQAGPVRSHQPASLAEGEFTEAHELDRKWQVPQEMCS